MAMAITASATFKPKVYRGNNFMIIHCRLTASGNYSAGGDALDFSTLGKFSKKQPKAVIVRGMAGFIYLYDLVNKKLLVFCNTAGGVNAALGEHSAAALVAGVTGDTIDAFVFFA
jgi:hypothetical protein